MTAPIPTALAAVVENMTADLAGATVKCEQLAADRWRVTAESDRVRMWADYRPLSRGRLQPKNSKLFIDGEEVPRANGYAGLMCLFRNPDGGGWEDKSATRRVADSREVDPESAPAEVLSALRMVGARKPAGSRVALRRDDIFWLVCLENERMQLAMLFAETVMDPTRPLRDRTVCPAAGTWITLSVDGIDHTDAIQGSLEKAFGVVNAHMSDAGPAAVAREQQAAVTNSVLVRKTTVIRN